LAENWERKAVRAAVPLTHPKAFTGLPPFCSTGLRCAPCKVSQPSAQVLLHLVDFIWDGTLQIPLQSVFSIFSCLTGDTGRCRNVHQFKGRPVLLFATKMAF